MEQHVVKIKSIHKVTHDVLSIVVEKPESYVFTPGQATEVSINKEGWQNERRPFTFTCLPENDYLEFTIKTYPSHNGVTNQLLQLNINDELILHDVWGTIAYKGEGLFIAGGAGVTPFISIFRSLQRDNIIANNKLIFANKTRADIIYESEFKRMLGKNFINVLSAEKAEGYGYGHVSMDLLKKHITETTVNAYLCGPDPMMEAVEQQLAASGFNMNAVVKEEF